MKRRSFSARKAGSLPGYLVSDPEGPDKPPKITVFRYTDAHAEEQQASVEDVGDLLKKTNGVIWMNVEGLWDGELLRKIGAQIDIHQLVLEDIQNPEQRPKTEDHGDYIFTTCKMARWDSAEKSIDIEHVSLIIGNHYVVSFQEKPGDVFGNVRDRILSGRGRIRNSGADYLGYALVDAIVDHYFIVLEFVEEQVEDLEDEALSAQGSGFIERVKTIRKTFVVLRRAIWPLRDMVNGLYSESVSLIREETRIFVRDVLDHVMQLMDMMEGIRETSNSLMDSYLSIVSFTMNQVMKVLTIIATIFIPLTFLAGIYGMNFDWMPELSFRWAYPAVLGLMAVTAVGMLIWFKRKKWL